MNNFDNKNLKNQAVIGDFVELIKKKNKDLVIDTLVGVDINKNLIEKKIKSEKTDLKTLQIVESGDFVMSGMNVERDRVVPISLYVGKKFLGASGSNKYYIFRVKDPKLIIPEFLNLIFKTSKIDLIGFYFSGKGVRGELEWKDFCNIPISVPPLEKQQRIVYKYQTFEKLIKTKRKMNDLLEEWMEIYYQFLFNGEEGCAVETFGNLFQIIKGNRPPRSNKYLEELYFCKEGGTPSLAVSDINKYNTKFVGYVEDYLTQEGIKRIKAQIIPAHSLLFVGGGR